MIRMLVVVQTAISLGIGEQVFLAGAPDELGRWNPAGVPMTRVEDNRWEAVLSLRSAEAFEFKITRGSWETEEADAQGRLLGNRTLAPVDQGTLEIPVAGWKDGVAPRKGRRSRGTTRSCRRSTRNSWSTTAM